MGRGGGDFVSGDFKKDMGWLWLLADVVELLTGSQGGWYYASSYAAGLVVYPSS